MKTSSSILLLLPTLVFAEPSLPLKMAHEKNFFGCDEAISKAFEFAHGEVRVEAARFSELKDDSIKLTTTSGKPGDSIYIEAEFRKQGTKCYWSQTIILTSEKNCMAYKEEVPAFKFVEQSSDFTWTENQGGINMLLKSVGTGCMAIFQGSQSK
jgi:hypothetical protein